MSENIKVNINGKYSQKCVDCDKNLLQVYWKLLKKESFKNLQKQLVI